MKKLRHGFKAQSERRSVEIRKTLGIPDFGPLKAQKLAAHISVLVWSADDVPYIDAADIIQLTQADGDSWSAFTLRISERHLVVFNPIQSDRRINSVVMHELAHVMLGHELHSAGTTEDGHLVPSNYNEEQESEADWLGGTLLLPRPALLWMRRKKLSDDAAADHFLVSHQMLNWRVKMTGIDIQLGYRVRRGR